MYGAPFLIGYAVCWFVARGSVSRALARPEPTQAQRSRGTALEELVVDLRETAWDHRDIHPAMATIMLDKIRTFERDHPREIS